MTDETTAKASAWPYVEETTAVPVWPYVMAGAAVKIVCCALLFWYIASTGNEPKISSSLVSILAIYAGIAWYSSRVNRPMQRNEILRFAGGTALADTILSALVLFGPILWVGETISPRTIDIVLGGDGGALTYQDIPWLGGIVIFSLLMVFGLSYFMAWFWTKKLPRQKRV